MKFGDCLGELVDSHGFERREFVESLTKKGIHRSLAYRWLRNDRTPKLNSGHLETIAECLALSQEDYRRLRDAQIESLHSYPLPPPVNPRWEVSRILQEAQCSKGRAVHPSDASYGTQHASQGNHRVVWGREAVHRTVESLLMAAPQPAPSGDSRIMLTAMGGSPFEELFDLVRAGRTAARRSGDDQYSLVHLLRLDANLDLPARVVGHLLKGLAAADRCEPRYFTRYWTPAASHELLIVPGAGAMLFLSTDQPGQLDAALVLRDEESMRALRAHFAGLQELTKPLLRTYVSGRDDFQFLERLEQIAEAGGDCLTSRNGLVLQTEPYAWGEELPTSPATHVAHDLRTFVPVRNRLLDAFYRNVERHRFLAICPMRAVERMVRLGEGDPSGPRPYLTPRQRLEQLENLIALVKSFDGFRLALVGEAEEDLVSANLWQVQWDAAGNSSVMMEAAAVSTEGGNITMALEILEPTVCRAFRDYALDLFENRLSPASKDKRQVVAFLEAHVRWLQERTRGSPGRSSPTAW